MLPTVTVQRPYRRRIESCACGGVIVADPESPNSIAAAVAKHNLRPKHQEWRAFGGFAGADCELLGRIPA